MTLPFDVIYNEEIYFLRAPVIVVLNKDWADVTGAEQLLLDKILQSVKQSLNGVRIVCSKNILAMDFERGSRVISFGVGFTPDIAFYQLVERNGSRFIKADPLAGLDDVKKKSLWGEMKNLTFLPA